MRDFEFIVLGSGTSAGVPAIGCSCPVCRSDDPRDNRLRTSAAVKFVDDEGEHRTILIDASPDLRQQVLREQIDRCDAILFTHNHVDHTFGLDEVRRFNITMKAPIDIYAEPHTLEHLGRVYRHIFQRDRNINDSFVATILPHEIAAGQRLNLYGLEVEPIRLLHGHLPILGFRFESSVGASPVLPLAWCTDVSAVPPASWSRLADLKTLFLDLLRIRHHPTHLNRDQAVTIATELAPEQTWFIHIAHEIHHATVDAELPPKQGLAWDGLRVGRSENGRDVQPGQGQAASPRAC